MWASAIFRLAREMRWPIVGSLTRNARDLGGCQSSEHAQGQRDSRRERERWMAAREDEPQAIVDKRAVVVAVARMLLCVEPDELTEAVGPVRKRAALTQPVDRPPAGGDRGPRCGVGGDPVARPGRDGGGESILNGVPGELEAADGADQGGKHRRSFVTEDALDDRVGVLATRGPVVTRGHVCACAGSTTSSLAGVRSIIGRTSAVP